MAGLASLVALIILIFRKAFDKKISPNWKLAMWSLLLLSLIIPKRITLYSNNHSFYTISAFIDILEEMKNTLITNQIGIMLAIIWIIGVCVLAIIYLINSIKMNKTIGRQEIKDERILQIFKKAKEKIGVEKEIKLIVQKSRVTPCIYGIIHPRILLTRRNIRKIR